MKTLKAGFLFLLLSFNLVAQQDDHQQKSSNASKLYFYWGWNVSAYTNSDIHFQGDNYDFTLKSVVAKDRQTKFGLDPYFNPSDLTIPQYNFRIGYYFKENWDLSIGIDHMKYVVQQNQSVGIDGYIQNTNPTYDDTYTNEYIELTRDFLQFEHTDGLNYANVELRHTNPLYTYKSMQLSLIEGFGAGVLYPRTNTTLLGMERYDEFHLAGYGLGALLGLRAKLYKGFFIQSELKGGFIDLPDVRTTISSSDKASQHFFFIQTNILFGGTIPLGV